MDVPAGRLPLAIVPGVMPGRWVRTWERRHPEAPIEILLVEPAEQIVVLRDGRALMALVRDPEERSGLHLIPLYAEESVLVAPRGHWVDGLDEVALGDLAEDRVWAYPSSTMTARQTIETVAAGTGVTVVPRSVARLHHRKDLVVVELTDGPESAVGLAWPVDSEDPRIEPFIGVVRGRTERSSRGS